MKIAGVSLVAEDLVVAGHPRLYRRVTVTLTLGESVVRLVGDALTDEEALRNLQVQDDAGG